jgi:hypothetical protein
MTVSRTVVRSGSTIAIVSGRAPFAAWGYRRWFPIVSMGFGRPQGREVGELGGGELGRKGNLLLPLRADPFQEPT